MMLPFLVSDLVTGGASYGRNVDKLGAIGLSPRMAILYAGDLLICLKDPTWLVQNSGDKIYLPVQIPCNWGMGLLYIGLWAASLRFWRDARILLLHLVIVGFLIPVTLLGAQGPWDEFNWASSTLFAVVLLGAFVIARRLPGRWGRLTVSAVLTSALAVCLWFLAGPKWGYFCPQWERAYVGRVLAGVARSQWNPVEYPSEKMAAEIRDLTDKTLARHPETAVGWYFRGSFAKTAERRRKAFDRVLELDPGNPLVLLERANALMDAGDWFRARLLLSGLVRRDRGSGEVYQKLAEVERRLGNYASSVAYALEAASLEPEDDMPYRSLFLAYDAMGRQAEAHEALGVFLSRQRYGPAAGYLRIARTFFEENRPDRGRAFLERAIRTGPRWAEDHFLIGVMLSQELNDPDRALEHFRAAMQKGSSNPTLYYQLGVILEEKGASSEAIRCYQKALQLSPQFGEAHARLAVLLTKQNRSDEARAHFRQAERLGVTAPPVDDGLPKADSQDGSGP
jgi:tetratricopeptide (TPR) repeat protein